MRSFLNSAALIAVMAFALACGNGSSDPAGDVILSRNQILNQPAYPPDEVTARNSLDGIVVGWVRRLASCAPGSIVGVHHFVVYRRDITGQNWVDVAHVPPPQHCEEVFQFVDTSIKPAQMLVYGVSVVPSRLLEGERVEGAESPITESQPITRN